MELTLSPLVRPPALRHWRLWRRWVVANALGELFGLAIPALTAATLVVPFHAHAEIRWRLLSAALLVLAGMLEGIVVGFAQWRVLRHVFRGIKARAWVTPTAIGAAAAWACGVLPSVLLGGDLSDAAVVANVISDALKYIFAAAMGAALGAILALPQWTVLRHHAHHAGWWIPANSLAWIFGLPIVFVAASGVAPGAAWWATGLFATSACLLAGAVVGAIHGAVLAWLVTQTTEAERRITSLYGGSL